jgi:hypothetical protein
MSRSDDTEQHLFEGRPEMPKAYFSLTHAEKEKNLSTHIFEEECIWCGKKPWHVKAVTDPCRGRPPVTGEGGQS